MISSFKPFKTDINHCAVFIVKKAMAFVNANLCCTGVILRHIGLFASGHTAQIPAQGADRFLLAPPHNA